jgi:hypothetical protein
MLALPLTVSGTHHDRNSFTIIGGDGKVYTSQSDAEGAMKTTKVCTTE